LTVGDVCLLAAPDSPVPHRIVRCVLTSDLALFRTIAFAESTVGAESRCSAGSPDSLVNYSGARLQIPDSGWFGVVLPGAPDTVWCANS
jgi:hypothetical protein